MKRKGILFISLLFIFTIGLLPCFSTKAAERTLLLNNGHDDEYEYDNEMPKNTLTVGDYGQMQLVPDFGMPEDTMTQKEFYSTNEAVLKVDSNGNYQCLSVGKAYIYANGYDIYGSKIFRAVYSFTVLSDVTNMTLEQSKVMLYRLNYNTCEKEIPLINAPDLTTSLFSYTSSNPSMYMDCQLNAEKKVLTIRTSNTGSTTLTIFINGKMFTLTVNVKEIYLNQTSSVLAKGKKTTIRLKGYAGSLSWKTTNKKIATVSKSGTIRSKKTGTAIIYTSVEGQKIGCAVSVVTSKMKQVISTATKMGSTWKYSQAKRMQKGYYDCSSLVWRSYQKAGKTFGSKNYAPVAADIAKYCASHKKMIKGGLSYKNIQKMKLRPGDIMFETGAPNGRYKGIYHVEMFVGYQCEGFNGNTPILGTCWAARPANYYMGCIMARP